MDSQSISTTEGGAAAALRWIYYEMRWVARVVISACERFYWDNDFSKAAALAYTSLLSLVPFVALGFGILASFALSPEHVKGVEDFVINQFMPVPEVAAQIRQFLESFSENMSALNMPMVFFFVVTSILLINAIEATFNETWQVFEPRPWTHRIAIFCAIILIAPVLALSVYVFVNLRIRPILVGMRIEQVESLAKLYNYLLPFCLVFFAFICLYYLVPKAAVKLKSAVCGALLTALIFVCAYAGFAVYIEHYASYDRLYGTIAAIPIFLVWLYIFWTIVLLGLETSYQAQHLPREGKVWRRSVHSVGDGRMLLAMQALVIITKAFLSAEKLPSDLEIAEQLGCSTVVLKPSLDALEWAQIISRGDTREKLYTLMRTPERITLREINEALFKGSRSMRFAAEMSRVFGDFKGEDFGGQRSLLDVVGREASA